MVYCIARTVERIAQFLLTFQIRPKQRIMGVECLSRSSEAVRCEARPFCQHAYVSAPPDGTFCKTRHVTQYIFPTLLAFVLEPWREELLFLSC